MAIEHALTVHFNDGSKMAFGFPEQSQNAAARQLKLAEFLKGDHLIVEVEDEVLVFPVASIKYLAFGLPAGQKMAKESLSLPKHVIRGARLRR
jgi:hypothetical protein